MAIQNVCYSVSEEEVFKELTKNIIGRREYSQKGDVTDSNKFCAHLLVQQLEFCFPVSNKAWIMLP